MNAVGKERLQQVLGSFFRGVPPPARKQLLSADNRDAADERNQCCNDEPPTFSHVSFPEARISHRISKGAEMSEVRLPDAFRGAARPSRRENVCLRQTPSVASTGTLRLT